MHIGVFRDLRSTEVGTQLLEIGLAEIGVDSFAWVDGGARVGRRISPSKHYAPIVPQSIHVPGWLGQAPLAIPLGVGHEVRRPCTLWVIWHLP